jgi:hypothetical protein
MTSQANSFNGAAIDSAFVAEVVRRVIARLQQTNRHPVSKAAPCTATAATAASISDRVVTAANIRNLTGTPSQVFVAPTSVVTPAARDEAKGRGLAIVKTIEVAAAQRPELPNQCVNQQVMDSDQPDRAAAVRSQLARRGITRIGAQIMLSDTPAAELHRCISADSSRAAMVDSVAAVDRFQRELQPQVWVLDMGRMNLIAAVNVAARIAQLGN